MLSQTGNVSCGIMISCMFGNRPARCLVDHCKILAGAIDLSYLDICIVHGSS